MTRRHWVTGAALITVKALRAIQAGDDVKVKFALERRAAIGEEISSFYTNTWAVVDDLLPTSGRQCADLRITFRRDCPHQIDKLANLDRFEWGVDYDEVVAWRPKQVKP